MANKQITGSTNNSKKPINSKIIIAVVGIIVIFGIVASLVYGTNQTPSKTDTTTVTSTGQTTWKMAALDYGNNRWFTDGIAEIQAAKNKEEATIAAQVWLEKVKTDPNLLVGAAKFFLKRDVDKATLVDANGYATDATIQLVTELSLAIGTAQAIVPAQAPENGFNSGIENGAVVQSNGVTGDRTAIQITLANGETVWILARCGNPVTAGSPGLPSGKTDNPSPPAVIPPTPTTPTTPTTPNTPPGDTPKSSNIEDYQRPGTDGTTDSGTGVKPPVPEVTTPAESTPPPVVVEQPGGGGVVDSPTNNPGSESGVSAPDITEPAPTTPVTTPVEPGVNPDKGGSNATDPGNPFQ